MQMLHLHFPKLYIALLFQRILHRSPRISIIGSMIIGIMMHFKSKFASSIAAFKKTSAHLKNPHPRIIKFAIQDAQNPHHLLKNAS